MTRRLQKGIQVNHTEHRVQTSSRRTGSFATIAAVIVVLAALGALAFAPAAGAAPKGVIDFYGGTGTLGGRFGNATTSPTGLAVNNTTGDIYVADGNLNRVQRLSSSGAFISAWGKDVIQSLAPGDTGTGFEVCTVAANCKAGTTGGLGGQLNFVAGIAVDQATGNVYVTEQNNRRISVFTAAGAFVRTFGKDVVASGSQQADERQTLTVDATGGQFKLSFGASTSVDLPYNAPASGGINPEDSVQNALNALASINAAGGSVTVTGGPGGSSATPYMIAFDGGPRADTNQAAIVTSAGTAPLSGGAAAATIATYDDGAVGFEICATAASCKQGVASGATPNIGAAGLAFGDVAVAPVGAPNAGNVLVSDSSGNNRVQEFSSSGQFVRMFGWDVVAAGPSNAGTDFEICRASAFDICKAGVEGSGLGQFTRLNQLVADATGNVYTVEGPEKGLRVQKFTASGGNLTPAAFNPQVCSSPAEFLSGTTAVAAQSNSPTEIAIGPSGNLLVVKGFLAGEGCPPIEGQFERRVLEFDSAGTLVETHASGAGLTSLTGMALDTSGGRIYLTRTNEGGVAGVVVLGAVPPIGVSGLEATDVGASTATLRATVEPAAFALHTLYRFEYAKLGTDFWRRVPPQDVDLGNGSGGPGDASACPKGNPSVCEVSQEISALDFETSYKFRVVAHAEFNGGVVTVDGPEFTTFATAPKVTTSPALWSSPPATDPTLLLSGIVNPGHDRTSYQFLYVSEDEFAASGFATATAVPIESGEAGNGTQEVTVTRVVAGLDPTQAYRFRLVATNSVGATAGATLAVAPPEPGDRFFEWVSNGDSHGFGVKPQVNDVADSGERAVFDSTGFGQPEALPGPSNFYVSERTTSGWEVAKPMVPDPEHVFSGGIVGGTSSLISSELDATVAANTTFAQLKTGIQRFGLFRLDGSSTPASSLTPIGRVSTGSPEGANLLGAASDLSTFVFRPAGQTVTLFPGEPLPAGNSFNLYKVSGVGTPSPVVSIVNRADGANGAVLGGDCGAGFSGEASANLVTGSRAVSVDGSVVYFTARPTEPVDGSCPAFLGAPARLFKRVGDATTVAVSQSQCTRVAPACDTTDGNDSYRGASADGSVVVFSTNRQLADSDLDTGFGCDATGGSGTAGCDLYLYDSSPPAGQPNLVQISAGEAVAGDHPTVGSGAVAQGVLDVSADGSRVYFVASGRLTSAATLGANNLYVYERDEAHPGGRIAFIAALAGDDKGEWGNGSSTIKSSSARPSDGPSGDGHALFLLSAAKLAAEDTDSADDLYRYDDGTSELDCLSCAGDAAFDVGVNGRYDQQKSFADYTQGSPIATADVSTAVFATAEQLLPEDQNSAQDVYAWQDGALSLISGATGKFGAAGDPGISLDGKSVFFVTRAPLAPSDVNGVNDLYVARVDGGFPSTPSSDPCSVLSGGCQGPGTPPPPTGKPISSATFSGSGNVTEPPPKRKRCKKGRKLRGGKCVKKKSAKQNKRANANRRASR